MSIPIRWFLAPVLLAAQGLPAADPARTGPARQFLARYCQRCHEGGDAKGGFDFVLDRDRLVNRGLVVPGKPEASLLYERVAQGEMPPRGKTPRPAAQEVALLREWIAAGAPWPSSPRPAGLTLAGLHRLIRDDLSTVPARQRRFVRYVTFSHLASAGTSAEEVAEHGRALAKLVNALSWHPRTSRPTPVDPGGTVFRLDLRDYRWTARTWDRLVVAYPYTTAPADTDARWSAAATGTATYYLKGDWLIATASRGQLYYDVLELPSTDRALERLVQVDVPRGLQEETAVRAGFNGSGVSRNNRVLERHDAAFGAYWRSHDFDANTDRQNVFENPLGPAAGARSFRPAGGEAIFHLPNGLHGYLIVDANGRRVTRAPVEIVSDPKRPDRVVEVGVSCMSCHSRGLIPKDDQVRAHVERNPTAFRQEEIDTVKALYPPAARFKGLIERDNQRYLKALAEVGVDPAGDDPVNRVTARYEGPVDLKTAAAELALTPDELARLLAASDRFGRSVGALRSQGGSVQRQVFEETFPLLARELGRDTVPARPEAVPAPDDRTAFTGHTAGVLCVALSPDGRLALSGGDDNTVRLWEVATGKLLRTFTGHTGAVRAVAFHPDGRRALSAGDRTVRVWDLNSGKGRKLDGHVDLVRALAVSADGKRAVSSGADRTLILWDVERGLEVRAFAGHEAPVNAVAISPDGQRLLSGDAVGCVVLWDARTGDQVGRWDGHRRAVHAVAFAPDGRLAATGGEDRVIRLWDVAAGKLLHSLAGHDNAVLHLRFSADGRTLYSASGQNEAPDRFLRAWKTDDGQPLKAQGGEGRVWCAAFAPGGTLALTGGSDGRLRAWPFSR